MTRDKTTRNSVLSIDCYLQGSNLKYMERWVNLAVALSNLHLFFLLINFHIDCTTRVSARSVSLPSHFATGQVFDLSIPNFQSWLEKDIEYHTISKGKMARSGIYDLELSESILYPSTTYYPYIEAGKLQKLEANYCECWVGRILKDIHDNENFWYDLVLFSLPKS